MYTKKVVFAISILIFSRTQDDESQFREASEKLHSVAQYYLDSFMTTPNVASLKGVLLLAHYSLLNPNRGSEFTSRFCFYI
jgi:hypothetical protein